MAGHFTIDIDRGLQLLRVRMSGFFSLDDVARYRVAIDAATAELGLPVERQHMLCDITDMKIQSQDVVNAFAQGMGDVRYRARPVGFVATSTLARSQLMRILGERTARVFASEVEAETWLFGSDGAVQAA